MAGQWSGKVEVTVSGFFTAHHRFYAETGEIAELTWPAFASHAIFQASGSDALMQQRSWLSSAHELVEEETVRATADRPGWARQDFSLEYEGRGFRLEPEGFFAQSWRLLDEGGETVLTLEPRCAFKQGAYLDIRVPLDDVLVAFAYYLFLVHQREAAAVVATTTVAVS